MECLIRVGYGFASKTAKGIVIEICSQFQENRTCCPKIVSDSFLVCQGDSAIDEEICTDVA